MPGDTPEREVRDSKVCVQGVLLCLLGGGGSFKKYMYDSMKQHPLHAPWR